jgi:hypothetical protein
MRHFTRSVGNNVYGLNLTDTGNRDGYGKHIFAYELRRNGNPIFQGEDLHALGTEGDTVAGVLLVFLTLRPGDTDIEYFMDYTIEQREFIESDDIDELQMWAEELEGLL